MGPERKGLEFGVGLFIIIGLFCLGYLSFTLGNIGFGNNSYEVKAIFSTVAGLKNRSEVTMAGVPIGEVKNIVLKNDQAEVIMSIKKNVKLEVDSIASIKTMGIIGDKYVSITPGASDTYIKNDGVIMETQPPLDIESLIAKFVFGSMGTGKSGK
ncbi:MAG: outer membrane lipid asymmetry maintenance protein MlaD [Deltaproteobacteria bacterium]|nr:outer membrane lipid asymmetry maintenance protein MlaD [Deltaproteobacteria bacterium]MDA8305681.1 outer membrane lipid asymmetry maintenance protein MlaD [Deltaproteobacteria bacterium]